MTGLAYDAAGTGDPPLVFLHGWCGDRSFFDPQLAHFSPTHRVVAVDLPGHGASPAPTGYSVEGFADDVAAVCRTLGPGRSVILGHSLGGLVALALTQQSPELVQSVVLVDPPPLDRDAWASFGPQAVTSFRGPDGPAARRAFVEQMFLPTDDADRRARLVETMCAVPDTVAIPLFEAMMAYDPAPALRNPTVPITVIASAVPANRAEALHDVNPAITTSQVDGAGHFLHLEAPEHVNPMIERFLTIST